MKSLMRWHGVAMVALLGCAAHSGAYFVWSVRHIITQDAYQMRFTFVRNAMGPAAAGLALPLPQIPGM